MVPEQLAKTIEFIFERSTSGVAAAIVIGPPANARIPVKGGEISLNHASSMPDDVHMNLTTRPSCLNS
jgi:hypothetical protein